MMEALDVFVQAGASNPVDDPAAHIIQRAADGMRLGGYGLLLAGGTVDELIHSEIGNEVLLIKYLGGSLAPSLGHTGRTGN